MFIDQQGLAIDDGASVLNGRGQGDVGETLGGIRYDPGLMQPYFNRRGQRGSRRDHLVILRARNFTLIHERFVAPDVVLRLDVIGNGLLQLGPRGLQLLARHGNSGASTLHFRL